VRDVGSSDEGKGEIADDGVDGRVGWGGEFEREGKEELKSGEGKRESNRQKQRTTRRERNKTNLSRRIGEDEASKRWIQAGRSS